jgi:hypothetical protein
LSAEPRKNRNLLLTEPRINRGTNRIPHNYHRFKLDRLNSSVWIRQVMFSNIPDTGTSFVSGLGMVPVNSGFDLYIHLVYQCFHPQRTSVRFHSIVHHTSTISMHYMVWYIIHMINVSMIRKITLFNTIFSETLVSD